MTGSKYIASALLRAPTFAAGLCTAAMLSPIILLALDEHCGVDDASLADLQRYWKEGHLARGTLSDASLPQPVVDYVQTLGSARAEAANKTIIVLERGEVLNETTRISDGDF